MSIYIIDMQKETSNIIQYIKKSGGYAAMKGFKEQGIKTAHIRHLVESGILEKIKPGLYRMADLKEPKQAPLDFIDASRAIPNGIICLASALSHHGLTTYNPPAVDMAIPNQARPKKRIHPPVHIYFFRERYYTPGIEAIHTSLGTVKIYNKEKTICDMFRYRNKLGEDLALEGLKTYLSQKSPDLKALGHYADVCSVKTIITPYIKSLAGI